LQAKVYRQEGINRNMAMEKYWDLRLKNCKSALEKNNFGAFIAETPSDAKKIVIDLILPEIDIKSVSWGDSLTLYSTSILEHLRDKSGIKLIEPLARKYRFI
jgi:L-lactate utilization protein LutB